MAAVGNGGPSDEVLGAILEREKQFPTGIGYGVAVPHGKTPVLSALVVVAGTAPAPVPYETIDGEPVRLFFLLAGPESCAGAHVKALSRISRLVRRGPVRDRLLSARTPEEFYRVLCEAEVPLTASAPHPDVRTAAAICGCSTWVNRCGWVAGCTGAGIWAASSSSTCATGRGSSKSPPGRQPRRRCGGSRGVSRASRSWKSRAR